MERNEVLRQITYQIYQKRQVLPQKMRTNYRIERVNGGLLCDLWFLTAGCTHDACGGCVMCNYGKGSGKIEEDSILAELQRIVKELPWEFEDFVLAPSGSMLDEREVSLEMREKLISILNSVKAKRFIVESRADTVTAEGMEFIKRAMPDSECYIEIGVESSNDWVLKHCVNKGMTFHVFREAVKKAHEKNVFVTANIGLGIPFMSERAAVREAVRSIQDVLDAGADSVVLFPYHVKRGTLLDIMYQQGMYRCVSLWALVKVLNSFSKEIMEQIQISWYKDYFGEERSYIYRSPGTCPLCETQVMEQLDFYRERPNALLMERLAEYPCECREKWERQMETQNPRIDLERVKSEYKRIAQLYNIDHEMLEKALANMEQEF